MNETAKIRRGVNGETKARPNQNVCEQRNTTQAVARKASYTQEKERAKREFFNARMENCLAIDIAVEYEGLINVFIPK